jgi:hypothetical protein
LNPHLGSWSVNAVGIPDLALENVQTDLAYRRRRQRKAGFSDWRSAIIQHRDPPARFPQAQVLQVELPPNRHGISLELLFLLEPDSPYLLWRLRTSNVGQVPVNLDKLVLLRAGFSAIDWQAPGLSGRTPAGRLKFPKGNLDLTFFANGWTPRNYTGAYNFSERLKRPKRGELKPGIDVNLGTPRAAQRGHFSSEMFAVVGDRSSRTGFVTGFLSQHNQFGTIELLADPFFPALSMWAHGDQTRLLPGTTAESDWAYLEFLRLDVPLPLKSYVDAAGQYAGRSDAGDREAVPAHIVTRPVGPLSNSPARSLAAIPAPRSAQAPENKPAIVFELEPGPWWDPAWEAWSELARAVREVQSAGHDAGIWIDPFWMPREHAANTLVASWRLRNSLGRPQSLVGNGQSPGFALDATQPALKEAFANLLERLQTELGLSHFGLSRLAQGIMTLKRHDATLTRAQALSAFVTKVRESIGRDARLLIRESPLSTAIGQADYVESARLFDGYRSSEYIAGQRFAQNVLMRSVVNKNWWQNMIIPVDPRGSAGQAMASAIFMAGGVVHQRQASADSRVGSKWLPFSAPPVTKTQLHVLDWFDSRPPGQLQRDFENRFGKWKVIGLFNWQPEARDLTFRASDFYLSSRSDLWLHEFWTGTIDRIGPDEARVYQQVPALGGRMIAVREYSPAAQYLGGTLDLSQGQEVEDWQLQEGHLNASYRPAGARQGYIIIHLPGQIKAVQGPQVTSWSDRDGLLRIELDVEDRAELRIDFNI